MLQIEHVTITHRKDLRTIIGDFSFVLNPGDRAVLTGEEGNGKSTLLKWIYDPALIEEYAEAEGVRTSRGEITAYLPQELPAADREKTVSQYISGLPVRADGDAAFTGRIAASLGMEPGLLHSERLMGNLSGGERVKVQMAGLLMMKPDILLLDEPSNDIDIETLEWMERTIREWPGGVLFVSHDETLIERTANRVILLEQLRRKSVPRATVVNAPFKTFMAQRKRDFSKQEQEALNDRREEKKREEKFRRISQKVERALENVSRQDPSTGRLLKKKMKAVKSLEHRYERERGDMTEFPEEETAVSIRFNYQKPMPAGKTVLDISIPRLESPGGTLLSEGLELKVRGPEKVCIIGANGCGKTTFIRRIAGELMKRTDISARYMPQDYEELLPMDKSAVEFLAPSGRKEDITRARTLLGSMKFTRDEMLHPVRELSGGQKAKLLLLDISLKETDVLILDEPTRNFSPLTAPEVREILKSFPGAVISVSHDRKYIGEVCTVVYRMTQKGLEPAELPDK